MNPFTVRPAWSSVIPRVLTLTATLLLCISLVHSKRTPSHAEVERLTAAPNRTLALLPTGCPPNFNGTEYNNTQLCSGQGHCHNTACVCYKGFSGFMCDIRWDEQIGDGDCFVKMRCFDCGTFYCPGILSLSRHSLLELHSSTARVVTLTDDIQGDDQSENVEVENGNPTELLVYCAPVIDYCDCEEKFGTAACVLRMTTDSDTFRVVALTLISLFFFSGTHRLLAPCRAGSTDRVPYVD